MTSLTNLSYGQNRRLDGGLGDSPNFGAALVPLLLS